MLPETLPSMNSKSVKPRITRHPDGIFAVDAEYVRPGYAAVHIIQHNGRAAFVDTGTNYSVPHLLAALDELGKGGAHFIRRGEYDWDDPAKLVDSLVAQIAARFPDQPEPEADARMHPAARLHAALQRVSQHQLVPHDRRAHRLIKKRNNWVNR